MCLTQSQFFRINWNKCGMWILWMWYGWAEAVGNKWNRANQSKARHKLLHEEGYSQRSEGENITQQKMEFNRNRKASHFLFISIINKQQTTSQHKFMLCPRLSSLWPCILQSRGSQKNIQLFETLQRKIFIDGAKKVFIIVIFWRTRPHNWQCADDGTEAQFWLSDVDILIYNLPFCLRSRVVSASSTAQPGSDTRYSTVRPARVTLTI